MTQDFQPKFTITNLITNGLTRIERARGFVEAASLSEDWIREMGYRALVLEAHHTTHIEGTRLTLEQAERLLDGESIPDVDPDDALELLNYRRAFDFISGYLESGGPITEGLIREIHKRLVESVRGAVDFRGGDQQARLPDEGSRLNLRQACDTTCDKLTTRLAKFPTRPTRIVYS